MSLIIDTNSLAEVFDKSCARHFIFEPVFKWINDGPGIIIYGGTTYCEELGKGKFRKLFLEYGKKRKAIEVRNDLVDNAEEEISGLEASGDFDDQHVVALLRVSKCKILVTNDIRSHKFVKNRKFYPKGQSVPKIYSTAEHKKLLKKSHLIEIPKDIRA